VSLSHRPTALKHAAKFIGVEHRHNRVMGIQRWALAADADGRLVGVVVVGNPKARMLQHSRRFEVTRLATDGTDNACSYLYGAAIRTARAMGIWSLKTYTLMSESGSSLRAVHARDEGEVSADEWDRPSRRRITKHTVAPRRRWELLPDTAHLCEEYPDEQQSA
jgi:hypothetical protein